MNALRRFSKLSLLFVVCLFAILSFGVVYAQDAPSPEDTNVAVIDRLAEEGLTQGDDAVLEEFIADDYVIHTPLGDLNRDAVRDFFAGLRAAMPDFNFGREIILAEGDLVATRTVATGTFENEFNSVLGVIPPTSQPFRWEIINIFQFNEEGKVQEEWAQYDTAAFMAALGVMPPSAPAGEGVLSEEAAAHFVERLIALFDGPNLDIADELFAPDTVNHLPLAPDLDLEAWKDYVASFYVGIPDLTEEVNQVIIASDRLVLHSTYSGTHTGMLFGVPGTGNPVSLNGISIFRFNEAGLVNEAWAIIDVVGLLTQIGAFPPAPAPASEGVLSEEAAAAWVEQFDAIFDGPNTAIAEEIFSPDFVGHLPLAPELDRAGWMAYVESFYAAFPDMTQTVHEYFVTPDRLILRVSYTGTHTGELFGVPATGNTVTMTGTGIFTFGENGLATENWADLDVVGVLAQIGAFPPAPAE